MPPAAQSMPRARISVADLPVKPLCACFRGEAEQHVLVADRVDEVLGLATSRRS